MSLLLLWSGTAGRPGTVHGGELLLQGTIAGLDILGSLSGGPSGFVLNVRATRQHSVAGGASVIGTTHSGPSQSTP